MARGYVLIRRRNKILYAEFLAASVLTAWLITDYMNWHPAIGILIGLGCFFIAGYLFFALRLFRFCFSILFSLGWAVAAFVAGQKIEQASDAIAWVLAIIAFGLSLWAHRNHFDFIKTASMQEYEI